MADSETEVVHSLTDRDPEELSKAALVAEWREAAEQTQHTFETPEEHNLVHDRRLELWQEMKQRVDEEPPECPDCGSQSWHQSMGDPKHCGGCSLELGARHEDLIEQINGYWQTVQSAPQESES